MGDSLFNHRNAYFTRGWVHIQILMEAAAVYYFGASKETQENFCFWCAPKSFSVTRKILLCVFLGLHTLQKLTAWTMINVVSWVRQSQCFGVYVLSETVKPLCKIKALSDHGCLSLLDFVLPSKHYLNQSMYQWISPLHISYQHLHVFTISSILKISPLCRVLF